MSAPTPAAGAGAGAGGGSEAGGRGRRQRHVLVTGAAGFVGSHLVRRLRADGHRVVGVDGYRGTTTPAVAATRLGELAGDPGFDLEVLDLLDGGLDRLVTGARAVFHLAARPGARDLDAGALVRDNLRATEAIVAAAVAAGVPDLVFASSSSVYGDAGARGACREDDQVEPLSAYATTKHAAELVCLRASLRSTVVRFFTVYGPHQRSDMAFSRFIESSLSGAAAPLYQGPEAVRDFTYVGDAVEGAMLAWERGVAPIYNVSGGRGVALGSARRTIEELTGGAITVRPALAPPEPSATLADLSLARAHLGYRPAVELADGLREQVAAARAGRDAACSA